MYKQLNTRKIQYNLNAFVLYKNITIYLKESIHPSSLHAGNHSLTKPSLCNTTPYNYYFHIYCNVTYHLKTKSFTF